MTTKDMTPTTGLAQQHDDWTAFYDRFIDADGHIHHYFTHVVTNGERLGRRPGAEERYREWRRRNSE